MTTGALLRERYRLAEVIGEGAQGKVYRAVDVRHGRDVAIKTRPGDDPTILAEARILYELDPHPNLPLLREDFTEGDELHLVMDWVDGVAVADMLHDGPLGLNDVVDLLRPIAEALDHLHGHAAPIVHGDVKPSNIVRARGDGRPVLVDLGLAGRGVAGAGSPGYRAPEVASGVMTPATDIYALAATAYTLVTGGPPAPGGFAPMPQIPPAQTDHIQRVIEWGLQIAQDRRPRRASAFIDALSGAAFRHTLPSTTTSFVGRIDELGRLSELLRAQRLVTILGPGGAGKTRLAIEAGSRVCASGGGVIYVDLVGVRSGVALHLLHAMGETEARGDPLQTAMRLLAADGRTVLFDNAEHLLEETAETCAAIIDSCPGARILVTSREALGAPGETLLRIAGLETPSGARTGDAVHLLLTRLREADPSIDPTPAEHDAARAIADHLEGLPLAIELAAARAAESGLSLVADTVTRRLDVLGVQRGAATHHRSVAAMVDHSYDLLDATTQAVLRAASVLAGGIDPDVLARIAALDPADVRASLVRAASASMLERNGERFRLLEPVRQRLEQHLAAAREEDRCRARLAAWTADTFRDGRVLSLSYDPPRLDAFLREETNLLIGLRDIFAEPPIDVEILVGLGACYEATSRLDEAITLLQDARSGLQARGTDLPLRARALLARLMGSRFLVPPARPIAEEVLVEARASGDHLAEIDALIALARGVLRDDRALALADCDAAERLIAAHANMPEVRAHLLLARAKVTAELGRMDEARALLQEMHDLAATHGYGVVADIADIRAVIVASNSGEDVRAGELCIRLLERLRVSGPPSRLGEALNMRGHFHLYVDELDQAVEAYDEAIRTWASVGDPRALIIAPHNLGQVALRRGDHATATALFGGVFQASTARGYLESAANAASALATSARMQGRLDEARRHLASSLPALRSLGDQVILAGAIFELARVDHADGDAESALAHAAEALAIYERLGRTTTADVRALIEMIHSTSDRRTRT